MGPLPVAKRRSTAYLLAAVMTIVADHLLSAQYAWRGLSRSWAWMDLVVGLVAGHLLLDAVTLILHFTLDNYWSPTTPLIGTTISYFREHHVAQQAMFDRDYFQNNFENALVGVVALLALLPFSWSPAASLALASAGFGSAYITQIHKWAHQPRPPWPVRVLQRTRLIVDQKHHDGHHRDASRNYGLYAGWLDRLLDALRLLELVELAVFLVSGAVAKGSRLHLASAGEVRTLRSRLRRAGWRSWYAALAAYAGRRGAQFSCMNWGYAEEDEGARDPLAAHPERYPLQLYEALCAGSPLRHGTVVDVSCGRGGGIAHLHRRYGPPRAVGIDLVDDNIRACRAAFSADGLEFRQGSAEALPLADREAHTILSVEASHCYGSLERFLGETHRALKPGGLLLWTDFAPTEALAHRRALSRRYFSVLEERDITAHVLLAMRLDAGRRLELIRQHASPALRSLLRHFAAAGVEERSYQDFAQGRDRYFLFRLQRPAEPLPSRRRVQSASQPHGQTSGVLEVP